MICKQALAHWHQEEDEEAERSSQGERNKHLKEDDLNE